MVSVYSLDESLGERYVSLGLTFMKTFYTSLDFDQTVVHLAVSSLADV